MALNPDNDQLEGIYESVPSFHIDYSPEDALILELADIYRNTIGYAESIYDDAVNTMTPGTTPLLHTVPYFRIPITPAVYPKSMISALRQKSFEQQIEWLDTQLFYVPFVFGTQAKAKVYDLRLQHHFPEGSPVLEVSEDYFMRDNKLYLLPDFIERTTTQLSHLHAFDIKIDLQTVEQVWGRPFGIETGILLPKYEYRNAVEAYHHVMQSDLTILQISEAIRKATGWEEFAIEDHYTPNLDPSKKRLYDEMVISPFTFIVTLPEYLTKDKVRINVALAIVDEAKETQTNYWFFVEVLRKETLEPEDMQFVTMQRHTRETTFKEDEHGISMTRRVTDDLFDVGRLDKRARFDQDGPYATYFDGMMGWSPETFVHPLNLVCAHFDLVPSEANFDSIDETLDLLTDMLNLRSSQLPSESEFEYQRRRLLDVLQEMGEVVPKLFIGMRAMRYDEAHVHVRFPRKEILETEDIQTSRLSMRRTDVIYFDNKPLYSFDSNAKFDASRYDFAQNEPTIEDFRLDGDVRMDTQPNRAEWFTVRRMTFPEIPREFRREPYYSKTRIVVRPNTDGTEQFQLEGSDDGYAWEVIEEVANTDTSEKIPFSHDVDSSETRYYRVRAIAGVEQSLPTLVLDASVLPEE